MPASGRVGRSVGAAKEVEEKRSEEAKDAGQGSV